MNISLAAINRTKTQIINANVCVQTKVDERPESRSAPIYPSLPISRITRLLNMQPCDPPVYVSIGAAARLTKKPAD